MQDYIEKSKKKKKKDDHSSKGKPIRNFQIIDDDININDLRTTQESEILVDLLDPEGPSIVYDAIPEQKPKDDSKNKWIKLDFFDKETEKQEEDNYENLFKKRSNKSTKTISNDYDEKIKLESDFNSEIHENKTEVEDDDLDMIPRQRRSIENDLSPVRRRPKNDVDSDQDLDYIPRIKKERLSPERTKNSTHKGENTDETKVRIRKPTKEEELKKAKESALKAKYADWKRGLTQKKEKEEKIADFLYESEKPLARYADDKDLDSLLKNQEREDDPMLAYLKKNKPDDKKEGEKPKQKYRGPPAPPNRYNILPGSKWDGVDRSNGFEIKYFESINAKKVFQEEAYKWSTEDM